MWSWVNLVIQIYICFCWYNHASCIWRKIVFHIVICDLQRIWFIKWHESTVCLFILIDRMSFVECFHFAYLHRLLSSLSHFAQLGWFLFRICRCARAIKNDLFISFSRLQGSICSATVFSSTFLFTSFAPINHAWMSKRILEKE